MSGFTDGGHPGNHARTLPTRRKGRVRLQEGGELSKMRAEVPGQSV